MESYDIIANQPVVIDNVRPGSWGEGGRPAPGSHAAPGGTPPVWARPLRVARRGPRAAWPGAGALGPPVPDPGPSRAMSTWGGQE